MTVRSQLNSKKRRLLTVTYSGITLFVFGIILGVKSESLPFWPFIGFGVFFVSITLYGFWGFRCPHCRGNLGYVAMYYGSPFSVSKKIKYCPFCGIDIDSELREQNQGSSRSTGSLVNPAPGDLYANSIGNK